MKKDTHAEDRQNLGVQKIVLSQRATRGGGMEGAVHIAVFESVKV